MYLGQFGIFSGDSAESTDLEADAVVGRLWDGFFVSHETQYDGWGSGFPGLGGSESKAVMDHDLFVLQQGGTAEIA